MEIPPDLKFWTPGKYLQNSQKKTDKISPKYQNAFNLGYLFRLFFGGGHILSESIGVPQFRSGGFFFLGIFVEIPGRAISGLCSSSGRSQPSSRPNLPNLHVYLKEIVDHLQGTGVILGVSAQSPKKFSKGVGASRLWGPKKSENYRNSLFFQAFLQFLTPFSTLF